MESFLVVLLRLLPCSQQAQPPKASWCENRWTICLHDEQSSCATIFPRTHFLPVLLLLFFKGTEKKENLTKKRKLCAQREAIKCFGRTKQELEQRPRRRRRWSRLLSCKEKKILDWKQNSSLFGVCIKQGNRWNRWAPFVFYEQARTLLWARTKQSCQPSIHCIQTTIHPSKPSQNNLLEIAGAKRRKRRRGNKQTAKKKKKRKIIKKKKKEEGKTIKFWKLCIKKTVKEKDFFFAASSQNGQNGLPFLSFKMQNFFLLLSPWTDSVSMHSATARQREILKETWEEQRKKEIISFNE